MDVKAWMVHSITYKQILHFTRRLYFGKFCYIIKFQVRGKYISIINIRRTRHQKSWEQRVNRRYKFLKQYRQSMLWWQHYNNKFLHKYDYQRHTSTQTTAVTKSTSSTQTKIVRVYPALRQQLCRTKTSCEHYPPAIMLARECQTDLQNVNQSIQCQTKVYAFGIQTNLITYTCCATQTFNDELLEPALQQQPLRKLPQLAARRKHRSLSADNEKTQQNAGGDEYMRFISSEKEAVVYMLSEIGELVLNQNHMLTNNTKMLTQISELAIVTKKAELAQSWKNSKKYLRWCKYRKDYHCCHHLHYHKSNAWKLQSSKSTLTDGIVKYHKSTQTSIDVLKNRRLRFFDKMRSNLLLL